MVGAVPASVRCSGVEDRDSSRTISVVYTWSRYRSNAEIVSSVSASHQPSRAIDDPHYISAGRDPPKAIVPRVGANPGFPAEHIL